MSEQKPKQRSGLGIIIGIGFFSLVVAGIVRNDGSVDDLKPSSVDTSDAGVVSVPEVVDSTEIKAKVAKVEKLKKAMRKEVDDMREVAFYYDASTTKYNDRNSLHAYIGEDKNGNHWLRLRIQYAADDWLFIQSYKIKSDSTFFEIVPTDRVNTDNSGGRIWETYDVSMTSDTYKMMKSVSESKEAKIRCNGKQYYDDRKITPAEKKAIRNVLELYDLLDGSISN